MHAPLAQRQSICAIAVTYHPDREFPDRIRLIEGQVGGLVIVDNGSSPAALAMLQSLAASPSTTLVSNAANLGVATALNIGLRHAASLGFAWVLLLDQDSVAHADMVSELCAVLATVSNPTTLAVIGSNFIDVNIDPANGNAPQITPAIVCGPNTNGAGNDGVSSNDVGITDPNAGAGMARQNPAGGTWDEVEYVITSGSLVSLPAQAVIGPFREELFIDYVDMEYCLRARAKGFRVIKTRRAIMTHAIGAYSKHRWMGKIKWTTNHSAERRYYIARNDTVMLREYGRYPLGLWRWKSFVRSFRLCKRIALFEDLKRSKIAAVWAGWWDGIRGRLGPRSLSE